MRLMNTCLEKLAFTSAAEAGRISRWSFTKDHVLIRRRTRVYHRIYSFSYNFCEMYIRMSEIPAADNGAILSPLCHHNGAWACIHK